jgi:uncharacterized protein YjbI with pentapeptide repeats
MDICKYIAPEENYHVDYRCEEKALDSGFCIFHDENYLSNSSVFEARCDTIRNRLNELIDEHNINSKPLRCIGYHLPDILIKQKFKGDLIISDSKIHSANFTGSEFEGKVQINNSEFSGQVSFCLTKFLEDVDLHQTDFVEEANFSRAEFHKTSHFTTMKFQKQPSFKGVTFTDDADFGETKFVKGADFSDCKFMKANSSFAF